MVSTTPADEASKSDAASSDKSGASANASAAVNHGDAKLSGPAAEGVRLPAAARYFSVAGLPDASAATLVPKRAAMPEGGPLTQVTAPARRAMRRSWSCCRAARRR